MSPLHCFSTLSITLSVLAHLSRSGELIVFWYLGLCRQCVCCQHFQTSSPLKPLGRLKPNLCGASLGWGKNVYSNGPGHMTKMAAMLMYGKNL